MSQTTWATEGAGDSGQIADMSPRFVESFVSESSSNIPFGVGVIRGSAVTGFTTPSALSSKANFLGVLIKSHAEANTAVEAGVVSQYYTGSVMRWGICYVKPEQAVTPADPVYCRFTAGAAEQAGAFRKDTDSGDAFLLEGARWLTSASADAAAMLFIPPDVNRNSGEKVLLSFHFQLEDVADGDLVTAFPLSFAGKVTKAFAVVTEAVTTAAKEADINLEINTTNVTGGLIELTSANATPIGAIVANTTAPSANHYFNEGDTLSVEAANTVAFVEGEISLFVELEKI